MKRALLIFSMTCQLAVSGFAQQPDKTSQQNPNPTPPQTEEQPTRNPQAGSPPGVMVSHQGEEDVVKITTNLVQIDPVITGKDGKQVTDLGPDEVQILEDGKPQKITNFSYIALDSTELLRPEKPSKSFDKNAPPVPPVHLRPEQVRRTMALVVDDLGLSFESAHYVREALKKFIDQQMQPNDLVAIIRTGGGMGALQQFTSDKRQLYAAVERVKWNPISRGGIAAFAPISADASSLSSPKGAKSSSTDSSADTTSNDDLDQFREDLFAVGTLGAVNYIVRGLRELPGRKSILLISDGFTIFNRSEPSGSERVLNALRHLTDQANRASVVIYTMDARGLPTLSLTAADSTLGMTAGQIEQSLSDRRTAFFESQSGLSYLAQQTGGLAIRNTNDLNGGIRRVIEDQRGYYLIGYRPDESTFDKVSGRRKFHKLALKVNRLGKFNVRMRNGFYGITDEEVTPSRQTLAQRMVGALISPFGSAGVHLRLTSLFANNPKLGSFMRSMLHVDGRDLTFTDEPDGWHKAVFDILALTFGDNGVTVDQIGRTHSIRAKGKTYDRIVNDGFTYNIIVPIKKPGAYQLRTALRDESSERIGSATQFIEVPDVKKNRLTLSGILMRGVPPQLLKKGASGPASQGEDSDDTLDEADPNANPAVRLFKSGLLMLYGFDVYNAQIDKVTGKPQLQTRVRLFRDGREVFAGQERAFDASNQADLKRLTANGALQLGAELTPGDYVLQVVVTDLLAKEKFRTATQWTDFEIIK
jgi:VWFA-related protein